MKNKPLKALSISILFLFYISNLNAQVGIGTTNPNSDALLEIGDPTTTITKGLLIPRVDLEATNLPAPLSVDVAGMIVYNKATDGSGSTAVIPGFYYNDGTDWISITKNSNNWNLAGNAGTNPGTNYIGTSDTEDLILANNATERLKLTNNEFVINDISNDYNFRVESNNQLNILFVDAGNDRIGIQTSSPSNVFHISNNGLNIGATSLSFTENEGTSGVSFLGLNTNLTNGYNGLEGGTYGQYSGVFGLGISQDNGNTYNANGVYGHANDLQGYAVYGVRSSVGGGSDSGFGGLFLNDLGYTGGLFNVSDSRLKKEVTSIHHSIDIIKQLNPVSYFYDVEKHPRLGLNNELQYGFIAQEIEKILPHLVKVKSLDIHATINKDFNSDNTSQRKESFKMIDYTRMIPILTNAIQEQQTVIEKQNKKIKDLEKAIEKIEYKINN